MFTNPQGYKVCESVEHFWNHVYVAKVYIDCFNQISLRRKYVAWKLTQSSLTDWAFGKFFQSQRCRREKIYICKSRWWWKQKMWRRRGLNLLNKNSKVVKLVGLRDVWTDSFIYKCVQGTYFELFVFTISIICLPHKMFVCL